MKIGKHYRRTSNYVFRRMCDVWQYNKKYLLEYCMNLIEAISKWEEFFIHEENVYYYDVNSHYAKIIKSIEKNLYDIYLQDDYDFSDYCDRLIDFILDEEDRVPKLLGGRKNEDI